MKNFVPVIGSLAFGMLFFIQSCQDAGVDPTEAQNGGEMADTVSFENEVYPIFSKTQYGCNTCHTGADDISWYGTAAQTYANLVNVNAARACSPDKRVIPGNADQSVLYRRLSGFSCGDRMPQGGAPISDTDLSLIRNWINQGALNN